MLKMTDSLHNTLDVLRLWLPEKSDTLHATAEITFINIEPKIDAKCAIRAVRGNICRWIAHSLSAICDSCLYCGKLPAISVSQHTEIRQKSSSELTLFPCCKHQYIPSTIQAFTEHKPQARLIFSFFFRASKPRTPDSATSTDYRLLQIITESKWRLFVV